MQRNSFSNPKAYLIDENTLKYVTEDTETGRLKSVLLRRGIDVTSDVFDVMSKSYHEENLNDRYWLEHLDFLSEKKKSQYEAGEDGVAADPISEITDNGADVFSSLFKEDDSDSEMVIILREKILPKLTENQINLIYSLYGESKTQEEIRLEEIAITGKEVTHQAISNRVKKLHKRVQTLMEEYLPLDEQ